MFCGLFVCKISSDELCEFDRSGYSLAISMAQIAAKTGKMSTG